MSYPDTIYLKGLEIETIVGIWDWERQIPQIVVVDLEMAADIAASAASDSIEDTLNYKLVSKRVQSLVKDGGFKLVETMAEAIAATIIGEFDVPWIRVRVNKPGAIRNARDVGVEIERGSRG